MEQGNRQFVTRRLAVAAVLVFAAAGQAYAQSAAGVVAGYVEKLQRLLSIIMGLAALVSLGVSIYHFIDQKRDSAKKLLFVFIGLTIGSFFMAAVAGFAATAESAGGTGLEGVKNDVKAVFQAALVVVAMIAMTSITIKMVRGEEEAYRKLIVWVVACSIGSAMLNAV